AGAFAGEQAVAVVAQLIPLAQRHVADRQRALARHSATQAQGVHVAAVARGDLHLAGDGVASRSSARLIGGRAAPGPARAGADQSDLAGLVVDAAAAEPVAAGHIAQPARAVV